MLDPTVMAIVTGAAGNLVALMVSDQMEALRSWIGRIFRGGGEKVQSTTLQAVHDASDALANGMISEADARAHWIGILAAYLTEHPESLRHVETLASKSPTAIGTMNVERQQNHGSGVFIGRDNHGDISTGKER